jgi:hypothetical protein
MATRIRLVGVAVSILAIVLVLSFTPEPIVFKNTASNEVLPLLGTLLFVALLVERALEVFVNPWRSDGALLDEQPSLARLGATQLTCFHVVDVLLTGGLLAGGSDAIHKMMSLYVTIMEGTSDRFKKKSS